MIDPSYDRAASRRVDSAPVGFGPVGFGPALHATVRTDDRTTVITVHGELDLITVSTLEELVRATARATTELVVLDCRHLLFCDVFGLRGLIRTHRQLSGQHRAFAITGLSSFIHKMLRLANFPDLLDIQEIGKA